MAISQTAITLGGVGSSLELSVSGGKGGPPEEFVLAVVEGMTVLAVTVTDGGPSGVMRGPVGVNVIVFNPNGNVVNEGALRGSGGQVTLVVNNPITGEWRIRVEHKPFGSAEICATAIHSKWWERLAECALWFRCKTCKFILKALVISALVHLAPLAGSALGGAALIEHLLKVAPDILHALGSLLGTLHIEGFLNIVTEYCDTPIDGLLSRVCAFLGLCR
jgi:hypothetical protein